MTADVSDILRRGMRPLKRTPSHARRSKRAAVLVLAMWLLLLVGLIVLGLNRSVQLMAAQSHGQVARVQARWAARAGVEKALEALSDDFSFSDSPSDSWYDDPLAFEDVEFASGISYRVTAPSWPDESETQPRFGIDDEASRLPINHEAAAVIASLPDIDEGAAAAIVDWRDNDEEALPGGAERAHYASLTFPYQIPNQPLRTSRELLLVKGVTQDVYFGEDADADGVLDGRENDGEARWPIDDRDGRLGRGLLGLTSVYAYQKNETLSGNSPVQLENADAATLETRLTFTKELAEKVAKRLREIRTIEDLFQIVGERGGEASEFVVSEITFEWLADNIEEFTTSEDKRLPGKVNVNTARREVLQAIAELPDEAVDKILAHRAQGLSFTRLGDLFTDGVLDEDAFRKAASRLAVRSNVFRILSEGTSPTGVRMNVEVIVDRGGDRPTVLYWHESE